MQSVADLNAAADDDAARFTHVALLTSDLLDGSNVADGGAAQAVTWSPAGDAGPLPETPALDGIAWSSVLSFDLNETATHFGLVRSGVVHFTDRLPHPMGPGTDLPYVQGVGPGAV